MDLKREIDLAIMDIRDKNYGMAEERLFRFLDLLDGAELRGYAMPKGDPAAQYREKYSILSGTRPTSGYMGEDPPAGSQVNS